MCSFDTGISALKLARDKRWERKLLKVTRIHRHLSREPNIGWSKKQSHDLGNALQKYPACLTVVEIE